MYDINLKYSLLKLKSITEKETLLKAKQEGNPYLPVYCDFFNLVDSNYDLSIMGIHQVLDMIYEFDTCIRNKKMNYDELINYYLQDILGRFKTIDSPGYDLHVQMGHVDMDVIHGNRDSLGNPLQENALFDIASMSKMFTQVLSTLLIQDGYYSYTDKVEDLDNRFVCLNGVTIGEIMSFLAHFITPGRIDEAGTYQEALTRLEHTSVDNLGTYDYNDIGMMILKEVMETVTGKSYETLLQTFILEPLGLKNTFAHVPVSEYARMTGSPNIGMPNDAKATIMGGVSGHAGLFASTSDLNKFGKSLLDGTLLDKELVDKMLVTNKGNADRSTLYGNVFIHNEEKSNNWVRPGMPKKTFSILGSTRVSGAYSQVGDTFINSTLAFNTASGNKELDKTYLVSGKKYKVVDARKYIPTKDMAPINDLIASLELRLLLIDCLNRYQVQNLSVLNDRVSYLYKK